MSPETAFEVGRLYAPIEKLASLVGVKSAASFELLVSQLPGLAGYWPGITLDGSSILDVSGRGSTMLSVGTPQYDIFGNMCYSSFDGTTQYHTKATNSIVSITGTETYIAPARRGLTIGGWFYLNSLPSVAASGLFSKWVSVGNERSYMLYLDASDLIRFAVSSDGTGVSSEASAGLFSAGQWLFIVGRFEPSVEVSIFVNGVKTAVSSSVTSIFISTAPLDIFRAREATSLSGRAALFFIAASAVSDETIDNLYNTSKTLIE